MIVLRIYFIYVYITCSETIYHQAITDGGSQQDRYRGQEGAGRFPDQAAGVQIHRRHRGSFQDVRTLLEGRRERIASVGQVAGYLPGAQEAAYDSRPGQHGDRPGPKGPAEDLRAHPRGVHPVMGGALPQH